MMNRSPRGGPLLVFFLALLSSGNLFAGETARRAELLFARRVLPIFKQKCFACHGADVDDVRGEFNMLTREGLLKGGESEEPSIVVGAPEESPLYWAVIWDGLEMPPKENDRLTREQTDEIEWRWESLKPYLKNGRFDG